MRRQNAEKDRGHSARSKVGFSPSIARARSDGESPAFSISHEDQLTTGRHDGRVRELTGGGEAGGSQRHVRWPSNGQEAMAALARSFPSLRDVPGTSPWDVDKFLAWLCRSAPSRGARHAAKFVLGVCDSHADWEGVARRAGLLNDEKRLRRFDLFKALRVWDRRHIEAFLRWVNAPFYP